MYDLYDTLGGLSGHAMSSMSMLAHYMYSKFELEVKPNS